MTFEATQLLRIS